MIVMIPGVQGDMFEGGLSDLPLSFPICMQCLHVASSALDWSRAHFFSKSSTPRLNLSHLMQFSCFLMSLTEQADGHLVHAVTNTSEFKQTRPVASGCSGLWVTRFSMTALSLPIINPPQAHDHTLPNR
jgi:hypothetical protein